MKISSVRYLFKEGFKNVFSNWLMSAASIGILVSCLLLTGAAVLFCFNISQALDKVEKQNSITVYLNSNISASDSVKVGEKIGGVSNVLLCEFYSKDQALEKYQDVLGELFDGLEGSENPLPNAFHVTMKDLSVYEQTVSEIKTIDGVDTVSDRSEVANKLSGLSNLVAVIGFWIVLILSAVSLFIISNTISVTMYSRRLEISIMKSVGATDNFIRVPFIVEGIVIGIFSAAISTFLLDLVYELLFTAGRKIVQFDYIPFNRVAGQVGVSFLAAGIIFGLIGGLISIRKYLRRDGGDVIGV